MKRIDLDLSLIVTPKEIFEEISVNKLNKRLFDFEKWYLELTRWIEFISNKEDFLCPEVIIQASKLGLGLRFTDDATVLMLNSKWRQKSEVTDVLSFPMIDGENICSNSEFVELGDLVISLPTAYRQAIEYEHDLETELKWLVSHGLLHLLEWDHPDEKSLNKMLKAQEQLLAINVTL